MTEREVTVETTQVETDTVSFCDSCGIPLEHEEYETLALNPDLEFGFDKNEFDKILNDLISKADTGDVRKRSVNSFGSKTPVGHVWHGVHPEIKRLRNLIHDGAEMSIDDSIDVCRTCLETELSGPDVSAAETLNLDPIEEPESPDVFTPMLSTSTGWFGLVMMATFALFLAGILSWVGLIFANIATVATVVLLLGHAPVGDP